MAADDFAAVQVCRDCAYVIANGVETPEQGEAADGMDERWEGFHLALGCSCCDRDAEPWFSWRGCEGCGSPMHGDRVHATPFKI